MDTCACLCHRLTVPMWVSFGRMQLEHGKNVSADVAGWASVTEPTTQAFSGAECMDMTVGA